MRGTIAIVAVFALCGCTGGKGTAVPVHSAGGALVDAKGMTVYVFDRDPAGKSVCTGPCAASWPPIIAAADAKSIGDYTVILRDDGSRQWAYRKKPLYVRASERNPGERTGDGVDNLWRVARP